MNQLDEERQKAWYEKHGGSAYPSEQHEELDGKWNQTFDPGISTRQYFAAKAMQAIVTANFSRGVAIQDLNTRKILVEQSFGIADAMMTFIVKECQEEKEGG